jgi:hypothetical protein
MTWVESSFSQRIWVWTLNAFALSNDASLEDLHVKLVADWKQFVAFALACCDNIAVLAPITPTAATIATIATIVNIFIVSQIENKL